MIAIPRPAVFALSDLEILNDTSPSGWRNRFAVFGKGCGSG
jgi:hypothetical protein